MLLTLTVLLVGAPEPIAVDDLQPVVLVLDAGSPLRRGDVLRAGASAFQRFTDLTLVEPERVGASAEALRTCPPEGRTACFAQALQAQRWLLVLSAERLSGARVQVQPELFDLAGARTILHRRGAETSEAELIGRAARRLPPARLDFRDPAALYDYFENMVSETLQEVLAQAGHWQPYGRVEIRGEPGLTVEVDGKSVGATTQGPTLLQMRRGQRRIAVKKGESGVRYDQVVQVASGDPLIIETRARERRNLTAWLAGGGAWVGALGAASLAFGLTRDRSLQVCFEAQCGAGSDVNAFVPTGVGLIVGGALVGVAALFEEVDWLWWYLGGSVAVGIAAGVTTHFVR